MSAGTPAHAHGSHDDEKQLLRQARLRDNDAYHTFRCWRYPKPRQVWVNGRNTAPHHRPATNNDLIYDLTIVIILASIGSQFRENISDVPSDKLYDWDATFISVGWNPIGNGAFQAFFDVFLILIMRWNRVCRFDNIFGQRDMVFELWWLCNIVLFSLAGASLVLGQVAPCYWVHRVFIGCAVCTDCLQILMYLYHFCAHGVRTSEWLEMKTWFVSEVVLTQFVPMAMGVIILVLDTGSCNTNFCGKGLYLDVDPATLINVMAWWDYVGSFVLKLVFLVMVRVIPGWSKQFKVFPLQVGNVIERFELLTILCLGEQVVALTSLTFTKSSYYTELWYNSTPYVASP